MKPSRDFFDRPHPESSGHSEPIAYRLIILSQVLKTIDIPDKRRDGPARGGAGPWWRVQDSNLRRRCRLIYIRSLSQALRERIERLDE